MQSIDIRRTAYGLLWKESREAFLTEIASCSAALLKLYEDAIDNVARDIAKLKTTPGTSAQITLRSKQDFERSLAHEITALRGSVGARIRHGVQLSFGFGGKALVELGVDTFADLADMAKIRGVLQAVNAEALKAYEVQKRFGWTFSERLWRDARTTSATIKGIVSSGIAEGMDSVQVARALQKYVREGANTLAANYPGMMKRMAGRVPKNLSYEALRLARTEMSYAYNDGTIQAARANPACTGVGFRLANTHPEHDICDEVATSDHYGIGPGNYPIGEEPTTQHPNCLCVLVPLTRSMVKALEIWQRDPSQEPRIQAFMEEVWAA